MFNVSIPQYDELFISDNSFFNYNTIQSDQFTQIDSSFITIRPFKTETFTQSDANTKSSRMVVSDLTYQDYVDSDYLTFSLDWRDIYNNTIGSKDSYTLIDSISIRKNGILV